MGLSKEQKDKLSEVVRLIEQILQMDESPSEVVRTWLSLAGDYCREVTEELRDDNRNA